MRSCRLRPSRPAQEGLVIAPGRVAWSSRLRLKIHRRPSLTAGSSPRRARSAVVDRGRPSRWLASASETTSSLVSVGWLKLDIPISLALSCNRRRGCSAPPGPARGIPSIRMRSLESETPARVRGCSDATTKSPISPRPPKVTANPSALNGRIDATSVDDQMPCDAYSEVHIAQNIT
jgi:hypothetical protein